MKDETITKFDDAQVVAYLHLKSHRVSTEVKPDGRVVFLVEGDISRDLQALYSNEPVGILDYLRSLKTVRSALFAAKSREA